MRRLWVVLVVAVLAGCAGRPEPAPAPSVAQLPAGKSDLTLEPGFYRSPQGFTPVLTFPVPPGWRSSHRGPDGFDLSQPDPSRDVPLVAIVVVTPGAPSADAALADVRSRANGQVQPVEAAIAGGSIVSGYDIQGGTGTLFTSAQSSISIDAAAGQRIQVFGANLGGKPILLAVLVTDATRWDELRTQAGVLLTNIQVTS